MEKPEVEFFTEDIDDVEYLNVGLKFYVPDSVEPIRCVLGAFSGGVEQDGLRIIKGLVEEAATYMQGVYSGDIVRKEEKKLEVVKPKLEIV